MPVVMGRKIVSVGDSLGITIPKDIVDTYKLGKGETIYIITDAIDENFMLVDLDKRSIEELRKLLKDVGR